MADAHLSLFHPAIMSVVNDNRLCGKSSHLSALGTDQRRQKRGEIGGRLHFHFLLAGLPPYAVQDATSLSVKAQWEKLGGGMARVREYDSRKHGLEYTLKCLNVTNGGANLYEVGKFSHSADEVMLSNSIWDPANLARVSDTLVTAWSNARRRWDSAANSGSVSARASARRAPDGLKTYYAQMKSSGL